MLNSVGAFMHEMPLLAGLEEASRLMGSLQAACTTLLQYEPRSSKAFTARY